MKPLCILIVEDDPRQSEPMRKLIQRRIVDKTQVAISIVIVTTLAAGLARSQDANATILDLGLPDSEPDNTVTQIRNFRHPVIVMTGNDDPELLTQCIEAGADHVFVKGQIHGLCSQLLDSLMKDILISNGMLHAA